MASVLKRQVSSSKPAAPGSDQGMSGKLTALESQELVLAFSGPIGCGHRGVIDLVSKQLAESGYVPVKVKISDLIRQYASILSDEPFPESYLQNLSGSDRYLRLQEAGNRLRQERGNDFLAQLAVRQISLDRAERHPNEDVGGVVPGRIAYLIDQLKNPAEVALLRAIYGANFFLIGVLCSYEQRKHNLKAEGIDSANAELLMERDRQQEEKYQQKLEKTLQFADFFIRNARSNTAQLLAPVKRFLELMHGKVGITPTRQEQGMYAAYSASLASACLSRQVGAAVQDKDGKLIATGCNDVPRGGGGLYREADSQTDNRCVHLNGGVCFNHLEKDKLKLEIQDLAESFLEKELKHAEGVGAVERAAEARKLAKGLATFLRKESRLNDLLEFSRSVHAEMDALISLSRAGSGSAQDGVLFTTTYPCHNCARHIIAAGIRAVYYIEPYEKSLALELHRDAIDHSSDEEPALEDWASSEKERRVSFLHFEGVAPRRFSDLFFALNERKDSVTGMAVRFTSREASKKVPEYLESYIDIESRVVEHLRDIGIGAPSVGAADTVPAA